MLFKTTQSHDLNLSKSSISGILSLSLSPLLIAFFLPLVYALSDIFFIAQIDKNLSAQLLTYTPYCLVFTFISLLIAPGASSFVTKGIAQFDYDLAEKMAGAAILWTFLFGCLFSVLAYVSLNYAINTHSLNLSTEHTVHIYPYIAAIPFLLLTQCYFELLKGQGKTVFISFIALFSISLNIGLNYSTNTYLDLQVLGVTTASLASLFVTTLILIILFSTGKTEIRIRSNHLRPNVTSLFSMIEQSFIYFSIATALTTTVIGLYFWLTKLDPSLIHSHMFNNVLLISGAICFALFSPCIVLLLSYQSISVFNLSTFAYSRVKAAHKFSIRAAAIYGLLITAALQFFPNEILEILAIEKQLQLPVLELCLYISLAATFYFINASWATFLQTQDSTKSAAFIIWLPSLILLTAYFVYPHIESIINIKQSHDLVWYSFIAAHLITSITAWVRFAFAFNEINKVQHIKPEAIKKLKVKTPPKPVIEKIIIPSEANSSDVNSDFDEDFLSSFATDTEEQLEEVDDIDEFEKAMQSYNQNMDTNHPTIELKTEQTEKPASSIIKNEPKDKKAINDAPPPSKYDNFPDQKEQQALSSLDDIEGSEDEFGADLFLDEPTTETNSENESTSFDFELSDEFTNSNNSETTEIDIAPADDDLESDASSSITNTSMDELDSPIADIESLNLDDKLTLEPIVTLSIDELDSTSPTETLALEEELQLEEIADFSIDELETAQPLEIPNLNEKPEIETITDSSVEDFEDTLAIEPEENQFEATAELSTDALDQPLPIEPLELASNSPVETLPETSIDEIDIDKEFSISDIEGMDDLASELAKIDSEFNELYEKNSGTDLKNLDELINAADTHSKIENTPDSLASQLDITESDESTIFTAEGDEEIIEIFIEEAEEIFEDLPDKLAAFKKNALDKVIIKELQRDFHTLKGGSRMAEIDPMGDLCHQYEILFERIGNGSKYADESTFQIIDEGVSEIRSAIKHITETKQFQFDELLVSKIKEI